MLWNASSLRGFTIEAMDGQIGTVDDLLFDDKNWHLRWLEIYTGPWLLGRKILLPLSALGQPDEETHSFTVKLTKQQVTDSPDATADLPVSRQLESRVYEHYDWNPYWQNGFSAVANIVATPMYLPGVDISQEDGDPHLRSAKAMIGYHIEAQDGAIGHVEDLIINDEGWHIHSVVVDTRNWLPGQRVVISPRIIREIDWISRSVFVNTDVAEIKSSPAYEPAL